VPFATANAEDIARLPHLRGGADLASDLPHPSLQTAIALTNRIGALLPAALRDSIHDLEIQLPSAGSTEGWVLRFQERSLEVVLGHQHLEERLDRLGELLAAQLPSLERGLGEEKAEHGIRIDLRFADRAVLRSESASG